LLSLHMADSYFRRATLTDDGFTGWVPFEEMRARIEQIPVAGGVYVVVREKPDPPEFLHVNPGGRFKGRNPTVSVEALTANWVTGADVLYIGKAKTGRLQKRLREFADFGAGRPIGHWGGRLIWQLADSGELLVAWKETPTGVDAKLVEGELIARFRSVHGKPPFANDPHLLGR
jgi:hypothetical protein